MGTQSVYTVRARSVLLLNLSDRPREPGCWAKHGKVWAYVFEDGSVTATTECTHYPHMLVANQWKPPRDIRDALDKIIDDAEAAEKTKTRREAAIRLWRFDDAPEWMQSLSQNGGDEDWVAHVPNESVNTDGPWNRSTHDWFGCAGIEHYLQPDGSIVHIGSHA